MFDDMEWERVSNDEIDVAMDQFSGLAAASLARVCQLITEVDRRQTWMTDGARNLTDWVASRLRVRHPLASQLVSVSTRIAELPVLSDRFARGELSLDQVDAISRMATAETETGLIEEALGLSNAALDRQARRQRGIRPDQETSVWERRRLIRQWNLDESELRFRGNLPGIEGRILDQAIDARVDEMGPNPETGMFDSHQTRAADALVELAAGQTSAGDRPSADITVFTDADALDGERGISELDNGAVISNQAAQRLACDATVRTVTRANGMTVGVGRRTRRIPAWLRELVHHRDGGHCQHPGCRHTRWLQIHHVQPWSQGGATDLDNLILICGFHHRFLHEHGWHITGPPERRVFRKPDWTLYPGPRPPLEPRLLALVRPT